MGLDMTLLFRKYCIVVALILGLFPCALLAGNPSVLRISAVPDENPTELLRKYQPLVEYLERTLDMEVRFFPVLDYAATVEAMAAGKLDMAWYGGFTTVQAMKRAGSIPIVQRAVDTKFHSKFIASVKSGIKGLDDLKGHTFVFGSVSSTSGHLMPRHYLLRHGIDPENDFRRISFSGAHDATVKWVESGKVDAGTLNEAVWKRLVNEGAVDTTKVKVIWTTPPYYDYNWAVSKNISQALREKIRDAFLVLDYDKPEHRKIMDLQRAKSYIATNPGNYKGIEQAAKSAGLLR